MRVVNLLLSLTLIVPTFGAFARAESTYVWRPATSVSELECDLRAIDGELERGLIKTAASEVARLEALPLEGDELFAFGATAIRAALESGVLTTTEGRASVGARIDALRSHCEGENLLESRESDALDASALDYALALIRAYYALGSIAASSDDVEGSERWLASSFELAKAIVQKTPNEIARPFLYWSARATLARKSDDGRFATSERFAASLAKASSKALDEYYFFARVLSVEIALEEGDAERAAKSIAETLKDLEKVAERPNAPKEIAAALLACELRARLLEGNKEEALRLASNGLDLLGNPLPLDLKRFDRVFFNVFSELTLARAEVYWETVEIAPETEPEEGTSTIPTKEELTTEARRTSAQLTTAFWRARASILARRAGSVADDWKTIEATAAESYRTGALQGALDGYDRAAELASASGEEDEAFRLRRSAAAIVDKVCRDETFGEMKETARDYWLNNSRERFESLARTRPDDSDAPTLFQGAIERAETLGQDVFPLRFERLTLFPNTPDRGRFAVELARDAASAGNAQDAKRALEQVLPGDPAFDDSIRLERALIDASAAEERDDEKNALAATSRLIDRAVGTAPTDAAKTWGELAARLDATELAREASSCWELFFEITLRSGAIRSNDALASAASKALERWESTLSEESAATLATIRSFKTSLALDAGDDTEISRSLGDLASGEPSAALDALERLVDFADRAPEASRKRLASSALDSLDELEGKLTKDARLKERAESIRADALRVVGRSQEALNLYAARLKRSRKDVRALRGIATLLSTQKDPKAKERALNYWSDLAELLEVGSPEWWDAKERCVETYCRLGRPEQAEKMLKVLWLTRSDPSDPERKARWEKTIADAKK